MPLMSCAETQELKVESKGAALDCEPVLHVLGTVAIRTRTFPTVTSFFVSLHIAANAEVLATTFMLAFVWFFACV